MPCYNVSATRNHSYVAPAKGSCSNEDYRNLIVPTIGFFICLRCRYLRDSAASSLFSLRCLHYCFLLEG